MGTIVELKRAWNDEYLLLIIIDILAIHLQSTGFKNLVDKMNQIFGNYGWLLHWLKRVYDVLRKLGGMWIFWMIFWIT